jgi:hypothetical protein
MPRCLAGARRVFENGALASPVMAQIIELDGVRPTIGRDVYLRAVSA